MTIPTDIESLNTASRPGKLPRANVAEAAPGPGGVDVETDAVACAAELVDALPLVMSAWRAGMRRNISDSLSVPQFRCLAFISRQPGSSVSDVTAFLGVTMATTSAMVDRLAVAGYVDVAVSPADRRRSVLHVSPQGAELLGRMRSSGKTALAESLGKLSKAELQLVRKASAVLHRSFHRG